jgi:hypothetical protein
LDARKVDIVWDFGIGLQDLVFECDYEAFIFESGYLQHVPAVRDKV